MAKRLFNGHCECCKVLRPRCARIFWRLPGSVAQFSRIVAVVCDDCRRRWRGNFRLAPSHR